MKNITFSILALILFFFSNSPKISAQELSNISTQEAFKLLQSAPKGLILLDVRTPAEWETGIIKGAEKINWRDWSFRSQVGELPKDATLLVYCKGGTRSARAASLLSDLGFTKVINMEGGILGWQKQNYPIEKP